MSLTRRLCTVVFGARSMSSMALKAMVVDPFCLRQFNKDSVKTPFVGVSVAEFEAKVNAEYEARGGESCLVDGYAPFCKHIFARLRRPSRST